jgi:hypothetical protein
MLNNLNMKLQDRISACLTVDRNIISKIIVRFPANSILLLYNNWLASLKAVGRLLKTELVDSRNSVISLLF